MKRKPARAETGAQALQSADTHQPAGQDHQAGAAAGSGPFERLFAEHWNRVCGVLFRLVGDRDEAEDLALEAFWRLYRRPPRDLNLAGWLYRVATNLGLNALRSRKRRARYEEEAGTLALTQGLAQGLAQGTALDPADAAELAEQQQMVRRALAELPARSSQMLVLRHSGLSYTEIAAALQIAPSSVGTLLARAEQAFEKRYRKLESR